ncbi:MAG: amidase [Desulfobacterales bacterium]|nr:amidase [Desulfobacterales bacterium]
MNKKTQNPRELTINAATRKMREGDLTALELATSCLERIQAREDTVHAWVEVYEEAALSEARRCDDELRAGKWRGELHGIPIGVKDIIDVKGTWTRAGSPIYPAQLAAEDAPAVKRLRDAGAIFLGKTETTPFANNDPTITCNPWNPDHTPGGSSSGSAAAVADGMCLAALGTQTGGSLLRPAAYCGIVGLKPTYGTVSVEGVVPNSWSLDHVGAHTRCVPDAAILWHLMKDMALIPFARRPLPHKVAGPPKSEDGMRLGFLQEFFETEADEAVRSHLSAVRDKFREAGAAVVDLKLPDSFTCLKEAWSMIKEPELTAYHGPMFGLHGDQYPPNIRNRIELGLKISAHTHVSFLHKRIRFQEDMAALLSRVDAAFMPSAPSTAPKGLASTGSSIFNQPWSVAGFPAMSIPSGRDGSGLPFAIQLAAQPLAEDGLMKAAAWCEGVLGFDAGPAV